MPPCVSSRRVHGILYSIAFAIGLALAAVVLPIVAAVLLVAQAIRSATYSSAEADEAQWKASAERIRFDPGPFR